MNVDRGAQWGIALGVGLGGVLLVVSTLGHLGPPERNPLGGFALGMAYLGPFALAWLGMRFLDGVARAGVWLGAGLAGALLAFTSLSSVGLVLPLPAGMLIAAGVRASRDARPGAVIAIALGVVAVTALAGALVSLFGEGRSVPTPLRSLLSLSAWAAGVAALLTTTRRSRAAKGARA